MRFLDVAYLSLQSSRLPKGQQIFRSLIALVFTTSITIGRTSYNRTYDAAKIDTAVTATLYQLYTNYSSAVSLAENSEAVLVIPRMSQGGFIIGG
ncbi:hypothetical protein HAT86_15705 [Roseovarius gahaiensis]|uniref:Uncharacterized protein n=1 Tax=Roseovarius gahaiensis TaxID=2716691 RepID=A0A967BFY2_9RHOB|nr:hypothetical protein [Roseovarius gahaiensis]NHQ75895.1 hypothetical protein [Roseovarius gahaiensis]